MVAKKNQWKKEEKNVFFSSKTLVSSKAEKCSQVILSMVAI
jgi:hypothetical protein